MTTEKLFQIHSYLKSATATIIDIRENALVLDQPIFAPEAGGQSCDLGTLQLKIETDHLGESVAKNKNTRMQKSVPVNDHNKVFQIVHVEEKDGVLYHTLEKIPEAFRIGAHVSMEIDWDRRFDHMQNHCAEHILSGILFTEYGIGNKGFHLGSEFSTLDADMKQVSPDFIRSLEAHANDVVFSKIPIEVEIIENKEDAEKRPLRKALKVDEDISIITIPGIDCVACCCPHPSTTAEVGLIKILKAENYKGMTRIYFISGKRAFADYQKKHDVITFLNQKYSSDENTLIENIKKQDSKTNQLKRELHLMKDRYAKQESDRLIAESNTAKAVQAQYEESSLEDLKFIAKKILERSDLPVILSSNTALCVLLTHTGKSKMKCGQIVKEFACGLGGKGGGSDTLAQALFTDKDIMDNFLKIVQAHML